MGTVYEAYDHQGLQHVAVKVLKKLEGRSLLRFKNEFRALADLSHPNLVRLYELSDREGRWFFSMELLRGQSLLAHLRPSARAPESISLSTDLADTSWTQEPAPTRSTTRASVTPRWLSAVLECPDDEVELPSASGTNMQPVDAPSADMTTTQVDIVDDGLALTTTEQSVPPPESGWVRLQFNEVSRSFSQLVRGLSYLHSQGRLHRDVKPSNVLVEAASGRVVLLDFGLVTQESGAHDLGLDGGLAGTYAYMAPERAIRGEESEASDWYSVGVMLYQALTGRLPFEDTTAAVLEEKLRKVPAVPALLAPELPTALSDLAMALLHRDPKKRPGASEILAALGSHPGSSAPSPREGNAVFVGREPQLRTLTHAQFLSRRTAQVVYVRGRSGMGKTSLVRHFLARAQEDHRVLVFSGRCHERESISFKAVDGIVDHLSAYLARLSKPRQEALFSRRLVELAQVFPVLARVPAVAQWLTRRTRDDEINPQETRRRAFRALRELLRQLGQKRQVILCVDDLQWADSDSAQLLEELFRPDLAPSLLLVATYRSEDEPRNAVLQRLLRHTGPLGTECQVVDVDELSKEEALSLVESRVLDENQRETAKQLIDDAQGSPFLLDELLRSLGTIQNMRAGQHSIDELIRDRLAALDAPLRRFMEFVGTAGRPTSYRLLTSAAEIHMPQDHILGPLSAARLIRTDRSGSDVMVEPYHDRVREAAMDALNSKTRRTYHLQLAQAHERLGVDQAEALVAHFLAAGENARASQAALNAARVAEESLAFERAAYLYEIALSSPPEGEEPSELCAKLGDVLVYAGRGADAAHAYLNAAEFCSSNKSIHFMRLGAMELLKCGQLDEGIDALRHVMSQVGLRLPESPLMTVALLLVRRLRLKLWPFPKDFERTERAVPSRLAQQIDACFAAALGLGLTDTLKGLSVQPLHLRLALKSGDPKLIARALTLETAFLSTAGPRARVRAKAGLELARTAPNMDRTTAAFMHGTQGFNAYQGGEFRTTIACSEIAREKLRRLHARERWVTVSTQMYHLKSLFYLGDARGLMTLAPEFRREAEAHDNRYSLTTLNIGACALDWIFSDQPAECEREVQRAMTDWSTRGFHLEHFWALFTLTHIDLYAGGPQEALRRVEAQWWPYLRSFLFKVQSIAFEAHHIRARACIAAVAGGTNRRALRMAKRSIRAIGRLKEPWMHPFVGLLEAQLAAAVGETSVAVRGLAQAEDALRALDLSLFATCARYQRGSLLSGEGGDELRDDAAGILLAEGIVQPGRVAEMLVTCGRAPSPIDKGV